MDSKDLLHMPVAVSWGILSTSENAGVLLSGGADTAQEIHARRTTWIDGVHLITHMVILGEHHIYTFRLRGDVSMPGLDKVVPIVHAKGPDRVTLVSEGVEASRVWCDRDSDWNRTKSYVGTPPEDAASLVLQFHRIIEGITKDEAESSLPN